MPRYAKRIGYHVGRIQNALTRHAVCISCVERVGGIYDSLQTAREYDVVVYARVDVIGISQDAHILERVDASCGVHNGREVKCHAVARRAMLDSGDVSVCHHSVLQSVIGYFGGTPQVGGDDARTDKENGYP